MKNIFLLIALVAAVIRVARAQPLIPDGGILDRDPILPIGGGDDSTSNNEQDNSSILDNIKDKFPGGQDDEGDDNNNEENSSVVDDIKDNFNGKKDKKKDGNDDAPDNDNDHQENTDKIPGGGNSQGGNGGSDENDSPILDNIQERIPEGGGDNSGGDNNNPDNTNNNSGSLPGQGGPDDNGGILPGLPNLPGGDRGDENGDNNSNGGSFPALPNFGVGQNENNNRDNDFLSNFLGGGQNGNNTDNNQIIGNRPQLPNTDGGGRQDGENNDFLSNFLGNGNNNTGQIIGNLPGRPNFGGDRQDGDGVLPSLPNILGNHEQTNNGTNIGGLSELPNFGQQPDEETSGSVPPTDAVSNIPPRDQPEDLTKENERDNDKKEEEGDSEMSGSNNNNEDPGAPPAQTTYVNQDQDEETTLPITPAPFVDITLYGIETTLRNVGLLSQEEIVIWERLMKEWFLNFFHGERRRLLVEQRRRDSRYIGTEFEFVQQSVTYEGEGLPVPTNYITYNQRLIYEEKTAYTDTGPTTDTTTVNSPIDIDHISPEELAAMPFHDFSSNLELGLRLREEVVSFKDVQVPLEKPVVKEAMPTDVSTKGSDEEKIPEIWVIAIIIASGAVVASVILIFVCYRMANSKKRSRKNIESPQDEDEEMAR